MKRKFTFFIIILAVILGASGLWYSQKNIYSKEILKLELLGPEKADLGEEIEYIVRFKNNGTVRLEEPKLIFEYPSYSIVKGDSIRQEIKTEELGGDIYPGEERTIKFKGRLMGKEGEVKEAKVSLGYRAKNLSAWYESKTTKATIIENVPLVFNFDLPSRIEPGKERIFRLNYRSNIDFPLTDLRIKIDYPSGFQFKSSDPQALDQKEWEINLLNRTEGGRIEIVGSIDGNVGEEKIFRAELGSWKNGEFILIKEVFKGVEIAKPDLYIIQQINGNYEYIASPGDMLHYEIFFKNLSQETLTNSYLIVQLDGSAFDLESIKAPTGDYSSGDNSIVFDWRKNHDLRYLDLQEEGKIDFWVELKEEWDIEDIGRDKNPIIKSKITLSQVIEEFETKVNSKLEISQRGFFEEEVFGNSGPIPPKVGKDTTYTIIWQVKNYYNEMKNVKVRAILPEEVKLTGNIFPDEEADKFTFDFKSREIVWDIGDLEPGRGVIDEAPNVSFQISLGPTSSQKGNPALLIEKAMVSGEDQWTEQILETEDEAVDTTLPDDPEVTEEEGIVK